MTSPHANALLAVGRYLRAHDYRFITVTPSTHRRINRRPGNERAIDLRGIFGWSRPFAPADVDPELLGLMREARIVEPDGALLRSTLRASTLGEMLVFHSAYPTDDDDSVFFGPDTYRFVGTMGRAFPWLAAGPTRAVDIGCGGGGGALAIARQFPHAEVIGADINTRALALTVVNARLAGLDNLEARHSDLFAGLDGEFDLVVSNPPYVLDPSELPYRHGGGMRGAELSVRIVRESLAHLRRGGNLMLYTGVAIAGPVDDFLEAIRPDLEAQCDHWSYEELDPDIFSGQLGEPGYEDVERIAAVWLHAIKR
ncbi:class I SAM-dependent methyltransferase [Massilia sp. IC2-477]|uniref:N5-glutamine methyltransferase family protein n=1 Tax=Massilia sp. IC2-477 TaxID=2887198 RepID=UPI001D11A430|nr:class I SAM-dependent methyltransferase [Massilia sp. IC2-477]MCC2956285.1 class I SAM-dependent methyltransferase [Massilia sp. IC2-477]